MNEHKQRAIAALEQTRGDDLRRARATFRKCTKKEMGEEYGSSGQTRAEILSAYEKHDAEVTATIEWVRSV